LTAADAVREIDLWPAVDPAGPPGRGPSAAPSSGSRSARERVTDLPRERITGPPRERITGVVLCGGRSRRMGTDKARLEWPAGTTLLAHALGELETVADSVFLAVGPQSRYEDHLGPGRTALVDAPGADGPLAGLAQALSRCHTDWLVCLPVDLPGVEARDLLELLERAMEPGTDLVLVRGPRGLEPLLGVFGPRCAAVAAALLASGERRPVALADPRCGLVLREVPWLDAGAEARLRNLNSPADFGPLESAVAGPIPPRRVG
jgi:molybdopterin-guanine dinucleotide biosynthesis protein A